MRKELLTSVCALGLLVGATSAFAGAYGETQQAEEMPTAPSAAPAPMAEPEIDYAAPGFYLGIGGLYAIENFDSIGGNPGNSGGFHVEAGYRIIPNLAVEARYENYLEFDTDDPRGRGFQGGHLSGWSTTANVKGYLLTGRWQPYAVFGLGYLGMDASKSSVSNVGNGFITRYGIGMDAYITEHISMGPEVAYVLPVDHADELDFITISMGLVYKF